MGYHHRSNSRDGLINTSFLEVSKQTQPKSFPTQLKPSTNMSEQDKNQQQGMACSHLCTSSVLIRKGAS